MATAVQGQREVSTAHALPEVNASQRTVSIQSPATTPPQNSQDMALKITQAQKQALIDNLQLEVTERARKLRAQYALQAQSLRTRIELRINRIPTSLRKANMGDLFTKYQEVKKQEQIAAPAKQNTLMTNKPPSPVKETVSTETHYAKMTSPTRTKGLKRNSDEMESSGKENASDTSHLPNPKKRTKVAAGRASRQAPNPSTVLSPKSSNSRTLAQSPIRDIYDPLEKANISRPISPLKPVMPPKLIAPAKSAALAATLNAVSVVIGKTKSTRSKAGTLGRKASNPQPPKPTSKPVVLRPRRGVNYGPTELRSVSNTSNTSSNSTGTTIMRKGGRTTATSAAPASKSKAVKTSIRPIVKKVTPAVEGPPPGRRVLRKRT